MTEDTGVLRLTPIKRVYLDKSRHIRIIQPIMDDSPTFFKYARHFLAFLLAMLFAMTAGMKLLAVPIQVERFELWGYPIWLMYIIGILDLIAAALLILTPTRILGAGLSLSVLIGVLCTHIHHAQWVDVVGTLVTAALSLSLIWLHWER